MNKKIVLKLVVVLFYILMIFLSVSLNIQWDFKIIAVMLIGFCGWFFFFELEEWFNKKFPIK